MFPLYHTPAYENAGAPKPGIDAAISLSADFSLLLYSVPVAGISRIPRDGSLLLRSLLQLLEAAHHKHPLQTLLATRLQETVDAWGVALREKGGLEEGYQEQVRLLQRRCDEEDYPIMLSLGARTKVSYGIPGREDEKDGAKFRRYEEDVPEPRNMARTRAVIQRIRNINALPPKHLALAFHPRLRTAAFPMVAGNATVAKTSQTRVFATALAVQLPASLRRVEWIVRVAALGSVGQAAMSVPVLRVGVVRTAVIEGIVLDQYHLGEDADSWCIQTGTQGLYKCHAGRSERMMGDRFGIGDVVTVSLDLDARTLALCINNETFFPPFQDVRGPVVPAICAGPDTVATLTLENCCFW